jgi:hypothetical protein
VFLLFLYIVGGRFLAMFAPRLLASPEIVDHGALTPCKASVDGYTQRDLQPEDSDRWLAADAA